eukprot:XP_014633018.1 glycine-rich cell wall structural protein-like [Glycine max]
MEEVLLILLVCAGLIFGPYWAGRVAECRKIKENELVDSFGGGGLGGGGGGGFGGGAGAGEGIGGGHGGGIGGGLGGGGGGAVGEDDFEFENLVSNRAKL